MKKLFFVLALVASLQVANAQVKSVSAAKSAVEAAKKAADDAKKATKFATWIKLGQAYLDAYDAPRGSGWVGAGQQELQLVMGSDKPRSEEDVVISGVPFKKAVFDTKNYYYNADGVLQIIEVTKPVVEDALGKALDAYKKAAELDVKGSKAEDIKKAVESISGKFNDEAYNAYTFGDFAGASKLFAKAAETSLALPGLKVNNEAFYNAGFTANMVGDLDNAKAFFQKAIDNGYDGEKGEAYAKIADILDKQGDKEGSKNVLEEAFVKYPDSQSILIGLINYYLSNNGNTDRLFELLNIAKKNEPDNASLYYVEGNINKQLGNEEAALAAYDKCAEVNPNYEYGYVGKGIYFYEKALDLQEKANNEMDDNKWAELNRQFEEALKSCIAPFESAFELTKDNDVKTSISEYLKNACFRFRTSGQEYADKYEKYNNFSAN